MYLLLIVEGLWGLSLHNKSLTFERLAGQFGVYLVVIQYAAFLLAGVYGHLSILSVRIEQRAITAMMAFFAFAFSTVANLTLLIFSGILNPVSLMLNTFAGLVAGIIYLHLKSHLRTGARGRWRYMR